MDNHENRPVTEVLVSIFRTWITSSLSKVNFELEKYFRVRKAKINLDSLEERREKLFTELGRFVYDRNINLRSESTGVEHFFQRIKKHIQLIEKQVWEIEAIKAEKFDSNKQWDIYSQGQEINLGKGQVDAGPINSNLCQVCHAMIPPEANFCPKCGSDLN